MRIRPPRLASWLLELILAAPDRDFILGDLEEAYVRRSPRSRWRAVAWYWSQVPRNMRASARRRLSRAGRARSTNDGDPGGDADRARRARGDRIGTVLVADVRHALRGFARAPGFAAVAVVTLALGIGANAVIFSVVDAVVLAPLPYPGSESIVRIWPDQPVARGTMLAFEERASSFVAVSAFAGYDLTLIGGGESTVLDGTRVSPDHFEVMGELPLLGRPFLDAERTPGSDGVVILSHALWTLRFAADPGIVGRSVPLQGGGHESRRVVGVMPSAYRPLIGADRQFWVPLVADRADPGTFYGKFVRLVARLRPDVTLDLADNETRALAQAVAAEDPDLVAAEEAAAVRIITLHEATVASVRRPLLLLSAAAAFVLLVACCNLLSLMLSRSAARAEEIAIRRALGAGRWRVARQELTEAATLGLLGGIVGLLASAVLEAALGGFAPAGTPRADEVSIDAGVAAIVMIASLLVGLLVGLAPAYRAASTGRSRVSRDGGQVSASRGRQRLNRAVVVVEVALSVVLVTGAGLMLKSIWRLNNVDPGFEAAGVVSMLLSPSDASYPEGPRRAGYYEAVIERVEALPGARNASMINVDLMGGSNWMAGFLVEGRPRAEGEPAPAANARSVVPGYFETMQIPLLAGRTLGVEDNEDGAPVVVINRALARQVWPDRSPLGQRIHLSREGPPSTVVGIVGDVRQQALDQVAAGEIYRSYRQWPVGSMYLMVRARALSDAVVGSVKEAVWSVDANVPISEVTFVRDAVRASVADSRFLALLLSGFATLALVLGCVGVYGVMAYSVGRRFREFGVRLAVGATPQRIVRDAVTRGGAVALIGVVLGLVAALAASRMIEAFLYEVSATDVGTFAVVTAGLAVASVLATYLPARRAGSIDVAEALRND